MRLLKAFVRGWRNPQLVDLPSFADPVVIAPASPAPAATDGPLHLDDLVDLALIMRELWLQDAGFSGDGDRARSIVLAALLRLFPDRADPVPTCAAGPACLNRPAGCQCLAEADAPSRWLDQFLEGLPRPAVHCIIPPGGDF